MKTRLPRRRPWFVRACVCVFLLGFAPLRAAGADSSHPFAAGAGEIFLNPPDDAKPWVYWYWLRGAVSKEGITADLEAMREIGIGGAYLMPIRGPQKGAPALFEPPTVQLSPRWWEMLRFAASEADRLGVKIALHSADGWATAGGPWITPELSMQRVTWSRIVFDAGAKGAHFREAPPLPPTKENYYRDIAVLAFPAPEGTGATSLAITPRVTSNIAGFDPQKLVDGGARLRTETPGWVLYEFEKPFTCRSITIRPGGGNYQGNRPVLEVSDDGKTFRSLGRLEVPRHGWQDKAADATHAIPAVTAKFFRFTFDKDGSEPGAEDIDSAKWPDRLQLTQIELSAEPRIPHYEGKSGAVWRRGGRATEELLPDALCVPKSGIVNLTEKLRADGTLDWRAPPGRWVIMRIGHTPTGAKNATGGGGIGLECDKFNPAAVRRQFDGWLGESMRRLGPELSSRVVRIFHTDSWEAGSQNWSPVFPGEFRNRRGYDPTPWMPVFAGVPVESADASERFLHDVRRTIDDLADEVYFATMAKLAREHGCVFSCEPIAPTMMGDSMRQFRGVDIPMGEFWLRSFTHDKPNDILDAASAAHVYGKRIVQAEAFTERTILWDEHPAMLKVLGDRQFARGINRFVLHVCMLNPWLDRKPGVTLDGIGLFFQRDQTWWKPGRAWIEYLTRCQALLQQGVPARDVAYFIGEELPARALLPEKTPAAHALPRGFLADSINRDALLRLARVDAATRRLVLPGGASYAVLVLPENASRRMTPELAAKIGGFAQQGLPILAAGDFPEKSPGLENYPACDAELRRIIDTTWRSGKTPVRTQGTLAELLKEADVEPDLLADLKWYEKAPDIIGTKIEKRNAEVPDIEWNHRRTGAEEIYFVSSHSDKLRHVEFSIKGEGRELRVFDAVSGLPFGRCMSGGFHHGRTQVSNKLHPNESVFIVIGEKTENDGWIKLGSHAHEKPIAGPWQVTFSDAQRGPRQPVEFAELTDWTKRPEAAIRNYSGTAVYKKTFKWMPRFGRPPEQAWLELGEVANIASVRLNGKPCGIVWTAPWQADITNALRIGENELCIEITNTWANRLIGDRDLPENERSTWINAPLSVQTKELLPAGLLGPVKIEEMRRECTCTGSIDDGSDSPLVEEALRLIVQSGQLGRISYMIAPKETGAENSSAFRVMKNEGNVHVLAGGPEGILLGVRQAIVELAKETKPAEAR